MKLIEAASLAPSAGNRQSYRLLVVTNRTKIAELSQAVSEKIARLRESLRPEVGQETSMYFENFTHFSKAPLLIAPIHRSKVDLLEGVLYHSLETQNRGRTPRVELDAISSVAAAIQNILLCAHALGLGACWMTGPLVAAEVIEKALDVPTGWVLSALIPIGYPDEEPKAPARRPLQRLIKRIN